MGVFDDILDGLIENPVIRAALNWHEKRKVFFVNQGVKSALGEVRFPCTIDKSHDPIFYLEYSNDKIIKIDTTDSSNITILTATTGGTWANRTTDNTYTKGGV